MIDESGRPAQLRPCRSLVSGDVESAAKLLHGPRPACSAAWIKQILD
ncbi:MAG TPA: hypothetical protein VFY36_00565 [Solirubrobacteraceae bacterium]|nr:hypothetical protein [Solirubrobacteraceae bacterium]